MIAAKKKKPEWQNAFEGNKKMFWKFNSVGRFNMQIHGKVELSKLNCETEQTKYKLRLQTW